MHAWAYVLKILGGFGELSSLIWGGVAAFRGRSRIQSRMNEFIAAEKAWSAAINKHDSGVFEFVPGDNNVNGDALNAYHLAAMEKALGRPYGSGTNAQLVPEQTALAVLNDQVRAVSGPVLLLVLSTFASTIGGLLSIN